MRRLLSVSQLRNWHVNDVDWCFVRCCGGGCFEKLPKMPKKSDSKRPSGERQHSPTTMADKATIPKQVSPSNSKLKEIAKVRRGHSPAAGSVLISPVAPCRCQSAQEHGRRLQTT